MQIFSTIESVTSTHNHTHINKPVEPKSIIRFLCNVSVHINGLDYNLYPAIKFVLRTKAIQFWIYETDGQRDADCLRIADAVGPPPSDYLAYWDTTGDNLPNLDPIAVYIGGVSGTHEADQLYFDEVGIPTALPVPYDAIIEVRGVGSPFNIATFDAANGSNLATLGNWSGTYAVSIAANIIGTIGHTNLMQFAKRSFAELHGLTYNSAIEILMKIKARKSGLLSGNTGNILSLPLNDTIGTMKGMTDIDVRNGVVYSGMFTNSGGVAQGLTATLIAKKWTKRNYNTEVSDTGTYARTFADTDSPSGLSMFVTLNTDIPNIYRTQITHFDSDGFPHFDTPTNVGGSGAWSASGVKRAMINEFLQSGGMPVIFYSRFNLRPVELVANTGTAAAPNYSATLSMNTVDSTLTNSYDGETATDGRTYLVHSNNGGNFRATRVSRMSYSGPMTSAGYITGGNWSIERIGTSIGTGAASSGNGQTFQGTLNGFALNESDIVNGEPTMYTSDEQSEVIFRIRRNAGSFGDERDWDFTIVAGTGLSGNADGIGILASFTNIRYMKVDAGYLYISTEIGGYTLRRMDLTTLEVETFIGVAATPGIQPQYPF